VAALSGAVTLRDVTCDGDDRYAKLHVVYDSREAELFPFAPGEHFSRFIANTVPVLRAVRYDCDAVTVELSQDLRSLPHDHDNLKLKV